MPIVYVYRCKCGEKIEDLNSSPPLCSSCNNLMPRVMKIYRDCARPSRKLTRKQSNKAARWKDDRSEQEHQDRQVDTEIARIDEQAKRDYAAGELSYKHGHGSFDEERQMAKEDAAKGEPHGAVEE